MEGGQQVEEGIEEVGDSISSRLICGGGLAGGQEDINNSWQQV